MNKVLQMIGMSKRAGKTVTGEFLCEKSIKLGKSKLVIIAADASEASKKNIIDACLYYNIEYMEYSDKESLGRITGGGARAVVSIEDSGFAKAVKIKCGEQGGRKER